MNKLSLYCIAIMAIYSLTGSATAQSQQQMPMNESMPFHHNMPMHSVMQDPSTVPDFPSFSDFPTPEELERMIPPAPMTKEKISQHFAKRKARIEQAVARDRKAAEKYAKDFARFQKLQADQLAKIMAQAEKQREAMLKKIVQLEQQALENFRQRIKTRESASNTQN